MTARIIIPTAVKIAAELTVTDEKAVFSAFKLKSLEK